MGVKIVADNRKARFDFFITDRYECGIELAGSEVKSVKLGHMNLRDSFCLITGEGEVVLKNCYIAPYEKGAAFNPEPRRDRKLLLHRAEINKLIGKVNIKGYTLVPLSAYLKGNYVKIEIGLAEGKKQHDKRQSLRERDIKRQAEREVRDAGK